MKKEVEYSLKKYEEKIFLTIDNYCVSLFEIDIKNETVCSGLPSAWRYILDMEHGGFNDYMLLIKKLNIELYNELLQTKTIYDLKKSDKYFCFDLIGNIVKTSWQDDEMDQWRRDLGLIALTYEEMAEMKEKILSRSSGVNE